MRHATDWARISRSVRGVFDDHLAGHNRLAEAIKAQDSLAVVRLPCWYALASKLIGSKPVCPSADENRFQSAYFAKVKQLRDDFIAAAVRSQQAGYDGVEIHGAHGYIVCQFLSELYNRRDDKYGGALENQARLLFEIVNGIRQAWARVFAGRASVTGTVRYTFSRGFERV